MFFDTHGARYGIMTTNLAEIYNWVLRGQRGLPLVAFVEGMLHGTIRYFQERYQTAVLHMSTFTETPFSVIVMQYMEQQR